MGNMLGLRAGASKELPIWVLHYGGCPGRREEKPAADRAWAAARLDRQLV